VFPSLLALVGVQAILHGFPRPSAAPDFAPIDVLSVGLPSRISYDNSTTVMATIVNGRDECPLPDRPTL
jgi:hypothetical protein